MKLVLKGITALVLLVMSGCVGQPKEIAVKNFYALEVENMLGENVTLATYKGDVLLLVNTASKCGFTGQYEGLEKLYTTYKEQGFVVMGFPSNDFLKQEPGSNEEIQSFCQLNYGVTFPLFSKLSVKGKKQHPLYTYLTSKQTNPEFAGKISWNFNKFLISRDGKILARFGSRIKPQDEKIVAAIEAALKHEITP